MGLYLTILRLNILCALLLSVENVYGRENPTIRYETYFDDFRSLSFNMANLNDDEWIVEAMHLSDRTIIEMNIDKSHSDQGSIRCAQVLLTIAIKFGLKDGAPRPEFLERARERVGSSIFLWNPVDVRLFLTIPIGLIGGPQKKEDITALFEKDPLSSGLKRDFLKSLLSSEVPVYALPYLLESRWIDDEWHAVSVPMDHMGPDSPPPFEPERNYPVRESVAKCLNELGIATELEKTLDPEGEARWPDKLFFVITIKVDEGSLERRLSEWLNSDDPETRTAAQNVNEQLHVTERYGIRINKILGNE